MKGLNRSNHYVLPYAWRGVGRKWTVTSVSMELCLDVVEE